MSDEIINFKKINFYNKSFNSIFLKINKGGYLVAPAASSLSKIYENNLYFCHIDYRVYHYFLGLIF